MMMRYYSGLAVGHKYTHGQAFGGMDNSGREEANEQPDPPNEHIHGGATPTPDMMGHSASGEQIDLPNEIIFRVNEAKGSDDENSLGSRDEDRDDDDDDDDPHESDDEEFIAMDDMYGES